MGVPALFRWLSRKYPKIVVDVKEADDPENGRPLDIRTANPNGQEFDNLYLDYNGIVHNCTHPEGRPPPETEGAMMIEIFKYTERLVNAVRPRKLLMIAIDGVAPRAKMNQQRSRRFRTAMDATMKEKERVAAIEEWKSMGKDVSEAMESKKAWDSNAITPGTPFMDLLAASVRYWIASKINSDPGWADLKVIISDGSVPGEGEHKIMDLIRRQRVQPGYDPNTSHIVHGLDADLIMLSLAAHEPHFKVLREDVFADDRKKRGGCHRCGQPGHHSSNCRNPVAPQTDFDGKTKPADRKGMIFLDVGILREYLEVELNIPGQPFSFDLERAIDDWIFMIFFVGNDFLPHLPSLDIREGAIDTLLRIWRDGLKEMGGYLTEHGTLNLQRAQVILDGLAVQEDEIFRKRREAEERQNHGEKRRRVEHQRSMPQLNDGGMQDTPQDFVQVRTLSSSVPNPSGFDHRPPGLPSRPQTVMPPSSTPASSLDHSKIALDNMSAASRLKAELAGVSIDAGEDAAPRGTKRKADDAELPQSRSDVDEAGKRTIDQVSGVVKDDEDDNGGDEEDDGMAPVLGMKPAPLKISGNVGEQEDLVKLWEPGYKERYYRQKFGVELDDMEFRRSIVKSYLEGLCWVLAYYYQGCPSWSWFYPHHFAPFAGDFTDLASFDIKFDLSKPVQPVEQLMSVFPAASRSHIPEIFHELMTEPTSEIIDFYPERFHIDMNGKKMIWQGVALLPFIDRPRLLAAIEPRLPLLTPFETARNTHGKTVLFFGEQNSIYEEAITLYAGKGSEPVPLDFKTSRGLSGSMIKNDECIPNSTYESPLQDVGLDDITNDRSLSVIYGFPELKSPHRSVLLKGYKRSMRVLSERDLERTRQGGVPDYQRGQSDGFHANRREIDGIGVSRARDQDRGRPYSPNGSYNNSGYNTPQYATPPRGRDDFYDRRGYDSYGSSPANGCGGGYRPQDPYNGYDAGRHQHFDNRGVPLPSQSQSGYNGSPYNGSPYNGSPYNGGGYAPPPSHQAGGYNQGGYRPPMSYGQGDGVGYRPPPMAEPYRPPNDGGYRPPPPARSTLDNRDFSRQLPAHLLAAAGQRQRPPSYKR